jgi:hypothetical protein
MKRLVRIVAVPIVAGAIYAWMITQAARDARTVLARRWWPGPPMDHP